MSEQQIALNDEQNATLKALVDEAERRNKEDIASQVSHLLEICEKVIKAWRVPDALTPFVHPSNFRSAMLTIPGIVPIRLCISDYYPDYSEFPDGSIHGTQLGNVILEAKTFQPKPVVPNFTDEQEINAACDYLCVARVALFEARDAEAKAKAAYLTQKLNGIMVGTISGENDDQREFFAREALSDLYQAMQTTADLADKAQLKYDLAKLELRRIDMLLNASHREED